MKKNVASFQSDSRLPKDAKVPYGKIAWNLMARICKVHKKADKREERGIAAKHLKRL